MMTFAQLVQANDPDAFALFTNPVYNNPTKIPDGAYCD